MSKFKVGDKVECVDPGNNSPYMTKGDIYEIISATGDWYYFIGSDGEYHVTSGKKLQLYVEPPKGTFERLMIEGLPQGGYKVTAAGPTYAHTHNELAAFSTLPEAVAFVGRNMK